MTHGVDPSAQEHREPEAPTPAPAVTEAYESPALLDLGSVRKVTQGNAKNGSCDATSEYYN